MIFDYATEYDEYWSRGDRFGEQSFADADALAEEILLSCGGRRMLDIGSGMGHLVRGLLRLGIDASGVDVSEVAVAHANTFAPGRFYCASVLNLPFESGAFDTVISTDCLEHLSEQDVMAALKEIRRVARRSVFLRIATTPDRDGHWHLTIQQRAWWEQRFFEVGFRKHPSYYQINQYEALEHDSWQIAIVLERIPDLALVNYPLELLSAERDLHMDMLRETGARSDAHVARYQWTTQFIRPGDTVLDAACGLGYGSYVLQVSSVAARTIGIDGSEYAIEYARQNFAAIVPELEFRYGLLPDALKQISDHSIDIVVSFETLEHVEANEVMLTEFHRILTPGGRIIVSVPNDWSDETGRDPNPFHLHVYTLERLRNELSQQFCLETLVAQTASQCKSGPDRKTWRPAGRSMKPISVNSILQGQEPEAEWWLAVAMRSPLAGATIPYRETTYPVFKYPSWNVTTFARDYKNPWLVKSMVDVGHRLSNKAELLSLAEKISATAESNSPDKGAALCILAYQLLSSKSATMAAVSTIDQRVTDYFSHQPETPHGIRWQISLLFVLGKLWMEVGDFDRATASFERCVSLDPLEFSPLLCNRTVEARLILGLLCVTNHDELGAQVHWQAGMQEAQKAIRADWHSSLGDVKRPAEFGFPELASVLEYASSCAYALVHIDEIDKKHWWWLHPRRDRLSQSRMIEKNLVQSRDYIGSVTAVIDSKQQELATQGEYIVAFKTDIASKQQLLDEQHQYIIALKNEIDSKQQELTTRGEYIVAFKTDIASNQQELAMQGDHIVSLGTDLAGAQAKLHRQESACEQLTREKSAFVAEITNLKIQKESLNQNLQLAEKKLSRIPGWLRKYL